MSDDEVIEYEENSRYQYALSKSIYVDISPRMFGNHNQITMALVQKLAEEIEMLKDRLDKMENK